MSIRERIYDGTLISLGFEKKSHYEKDGTIATYEGENIVFSRSVTFMSSTIVLTQTCKELDKVSLYGTYKRVERAAQKLAAANPTPAKECRKGCKCITCKLEDEIKDTNDFYLNNDF